LVIINDRTTKAKTKILIMSKYCYRKSFLSTVYVHVLFLNVTTHKSKKNNATTAKEYIMKILNKSLKLITLVVLLLIPQSNLNANKMLSRIIIIGVAITITYVASKGIRWIWNSFSVPGDVKKIKKTAKQILEESRKANQEREEYNKKLDAEIEQGFKDVQESIDQVNRHVRRDLSAIRQDTSGIPNIKEQLNRIEKSLNDKQAKKTTQLNLNAQI